MAQQFIQITLNVNRAEDLSRVVDQIHTFAARSTPGSNCQITIVGPSAPEALKKLKSTSKEEQDLL